MFLITNEVLFDRMCIVLLECRVEDIFKSDIEDILHLINAGCFQKHLKNVL